MTQHRAAPGINEPPDEAEHLFSGLIGSEYQMLDLVCPAVSDMSRRVGDFAAGLPATAAQRPGHLNVFEIGCGTGRTTLALLRARPDLVLNAADNEPVMLNQARGNLASFLDQGRVRLIEADALTALRGPAPESVDLVASAYTLHNFLEAYRGHVLAEIFRVLRPGGVFVNGDRYALDDAAEHTRLMQEEVRRYFKVFPAISRLDLLEQWVIHLFSDESPGHIMRLGASLTTMRAIGFDPVEVHFREGVNALLAATKPPA